MGVDFLVVVFKAAAVGEESLDDVDASERMEGSGVVESVPGEVMSGVPVDEVLESVVSVGEEERSGSMDGLLVLDVVVVGVVVVVCEVVVVDGGGGGGGATDVGPSS